MVESARLGVGSNWRAGERYRLEKPVVHCSEFGGLAKVRKDVDGLLDWQSATECITRR